MLAIYLFCLGLGGVLLITTFFGDAEGHDDFGSAHWQELFSLRNITYFLFAFGAVGSLLSWYRGGKPGIPDLVMALSTGLVMAALVNWVFGYIRRTDSSEVASDTALVGLSARVTLPVGSAYLGKIELSFGGQRVELLARPFDSTSDATEQIENGAEVVIVEMVAGTALVSRTSSD